MSTAPHQAKFTGRLPQGKQSPVLLNNSDLGAHLHICAFFSNPDEEYRTLLPFIREGLENGEKAFHTVDPGRREDHLRRLEAGGLNASALCQTCQMEVRDWNAMHLQDGQFDQDKTLARFKEVVESAKTRGFPLIRFITHMEWALENVPGVNDLLEYEAKANYIWLNQKGRINPVICTYNLTKFSGEVIVDIIRTHPLVIIGGILQENPFFVTPEIFLEELREKRMALKR
jgi:hypothetical protein